MDEHPHTNLQEIYYQASEWIRMCNNIIWAMGTFLVPLSIGCIGIAVQYPEHKYFLAPASVFIFCFWIYVSKLYRASAVSARQVLMGIEREWGIKEELALYQSHGQVGLSRLGLFSTQLVCLAILALVWILLLLRVVHLGA
jgi:hypothetical protein